MTAVLSILAPALIAAGACVTAAVYQWRISKKYERFLHSLVLRPNCLLARHPIVLLTRPRGLFRLTHAWNFASGYLREHGYDVRTVESRGDCHEILAKIDEFQENCHVVGDASWQNTITRLEALNHPRIASLSAIRTPLREPGRGAALDQILDLAISLAERDAQWCD